MDVVAECFHGFGSGTDVFLNNVDQSVGAHGFGDAERRAV